MNNYDLILVVDYFRPLTYYFSIIKYLREDFQIGLFLVPLRASLAKKSGKTQKKFVQLCIDLGAKLAREGQVRSKVVLYPQWPYEPEVVQLLNDRIQAKRRLGSLTLAFPGLHDNFLDQFDIEKVFVIDKRFFNYLLEHRGDRSLYEGRELVEVGLPYKEYPVFTEFETDYILAIPTPFSFPHEKDKWSFLETVLSLLKNISSDDEVVHKPHNAQEHDYFSTRNYRMLAQSFKVLPESVIVKIFKQAEASRGKRKTDHMGKLYTAFLYEKIMHRVVPMEKMTRHHNFAMEAFLPGVKKGVIGGLSNTIWGALFFNLPFYNCVDIEDQDRHTNDKLYNKNPSHLLDLNLRFFHVPYCKAKLKFDPKHFDIIDKSTRQGDLIKELKSEIICHSS